MKVLIIGTGYVGMNTGAVLAYLGNQVTCLDVNEEKIALLQQGISPVYEPHLEETLQLVSDKIRFTSSYAEADIPNTDVIFITVGTPSLPDGNANLHYVRQAAEAIAENLGDNFTVIVNKSTVPIGSGNWVEAIMHEHFNNNHNDGECADFNVVSSPEFLAQGSAMHNSFYPDRIVVGSQCERSVECLKELFGPIMRQDFPAPPGLPRPEGLTEVPLLACDLTSAEMIKYASNSLLATLISFSNEIAAMSEEVGNIDALKVLEGVNLDKRITPNVEGKIIKPDITKYLKPGRGFGGSCFPKDVKSLIAFSTKQGYTPKILKSVIEVNESQTERIISILKREISNIEDKIIAILGLAFKANTDDVRESPSIRLIRELLTKGGKLNCYDPIAIENAKEELPDDPHIKFVDSYEEALELADAAVIMTAWDVISNITFDEFKKFMKSPIIIDGCRIFEKSKAESLGVRYVGIGLRE